MVTVIGQGGPTIILEGPGNTVQTPPLGELSLVVITVDAQEYVLPQLPNIIPEEAMKMWLAAQAELATRSTQVTQVFVKNTNH